jgi:hypothetical protein
MQNPIDQAEASISTETVREGPNLNRTVSVQRKATKCSESWYLVPPLPQNTAVPLPPSPQGGDIPERKKPRLDEPLPTATDEAARKTASPDFSLGLPPPAADNNDANADLVTDTTPNTGATSHWLRLTLEEVAELTSAVAKTKKKRWGKEFKIDWVVIATLVSDRTDEQCYRRWRYHSSDPSIALTAVRKG